MRKLLLTVIVGLGVVGAYAGAAYAFGLPPFGAADGSSPCRAVPSRLVEDVVPNGVGAESYENGGRATCKWRVAVASTSKNRAAYRWLTVTYQRSSDPKASLEQAEPEGAKTKPLDALSPGSFEAELSAADFFRDGAVQLMTSPGDGQTIQITLTEMEFPRSSDLTDRISFAPQVRETLREIAGRAVPLDSARLTTPTLTSAGFERIDRLPGELCASISDDVLKRLLDTDEGYGPPQDVGPAAKCEFRTPKGAENPPKVGRLGVYVRALPSAKYLADHLRTSDQGTWLTIDGRRDLDPAWGEPVYSSVVTGTDGRGRAGRPLEATAEIVLKRANVVIRIEYSASRRSADGKAYEPVPVAEAEEGALSVARELLERF